MGTTWTVRKVVQTKMKEEIMALVKEKAVDHSRDERIKVYPACLSKVTKDLSTEKLREFEQLAEKWNKEGASEQVQAKYVGFSIVSNAVS
jgi:hypothetical protein